MQIRCLALSFLFAAALPGQESQTKVKNVPVSPTSPVSGKQMYVTYCAACHGVDGKGAGPAAPAMKNTPTDLTALARNNGGKYPELRVMSSLNGDNMTAAHGSKEMPVWGSVFRGMGREDQARIRMTNLSHYIQSIQAK
jgi:mono/diheme cytochrome c family protein